MMRSSRIVPLRGLGDLFSMVRAMWAAVDSLAVTLAAHCFDAGDAAGVGVARAAGGEGATGREGAAQAPTKAVATARRLAGLRMLRAYPSPPGDGRSGFPLTAV
jgi:hypothetical protein